MENLSLWSSFLKMIFALAIVLGLLLGVLYLVKKMMRRSLPAAGDSPPIRIIASRYLGPKSSIILVEVADAVIVVGISAQQMTPLAAIDDPSAVLKIGSRPGPAEPSGFPGEQIAALLSNARRMSWGKKPEKADK